MTGNVILIQLLATMFLQGAEARSEVDVMRADAAALAAYAETPLARHFLSATAGLPAVSTRTVYRDPETRRYYSAAAVEELEPVLRDRLKRKSLDETFYYTTKYGTPLAYVRALDLLGKAGLEEVRGKRILDFGYGTIGHLRLLASLGAEVVGVDVDTLLPALYNEPGDVGTVKGRHGRDGRVTLVHGKFPAEKDVVGAVGEGYDLIISKNTLKEGYLHPARPVDDRLLVHLGVDDETFVRALYRILKPGGRVMLYNLYPAQSPPDKPYKPWADGKCPFPRQLWESAGFVVMALDVDDSRAARAMGRILGWDEGKGAMDLENDLFALYTIAEKPGR